MENHVTVAGAMHLAVAAIGLVNPPFRPFLAGYTVWVPLKSDPPPTV